MGKKHLRESRGCARALRHFAPSRVLAGKSFAFEEDYRGAAAGSPWKDAP